MKPFFLNGPNGPLFSQFYQPEQRWTEAIVHCPAFAEEMNKSRALVAQQARQWAAKGIAVLCFDYSGTGDSAGDFGSATWQDWLHDLATAIQWLQTQGAQQIHLWGLRCGCLLACAFIARRTVEIDTLIAWQPVLNGDSFVTQFLRLRIAAAMMDPNAKSEKVSDLKHMLLSGTAIEVAGYQLNPQLIGPLSALRCEQLELSALKRIEIFEVVAQSDTPSALPLQNWLSQLQQQGIPARLQQVVDAPFWSSQEIAPAPNLLAASSAWSGGHNVA